MKNMMVCLGVLALSIGLVGTVWAHLPAGKTYFAFQWPDGFLPKIDGDVSEWDIVPDPYIQRQEDLYEQVAGRGKAGTGFDATEFYSTSIVGYNASTERLYFMSKWFDDEHSIKRTSPGAVWADDVWEIMLDGDHSGGQYQWFPGLSEVEAKRLNGSTGDQYGLAVPPVEGIAFAHGNAATWSIEEPYVDYAWSFEGQEFGESTYFHELYIVPWDDQNWEGPDVSKVSDLEEGRIVGIGYAMADHDPGVAEGYRGYWTVSGGDATCGKADVLADFFLAPLEEDAFGPPTAAEPSTWARIKSQFAK